MIKKPGVDCLISCAALLFILLLSVMQMAGKECGPVVADSLSHMPLSNASIFDRRGNFVGTSGHDGRMPCVGAADYPVTVRYMGFKERSVGYSGTDTVFMQESAMELPEVVVESRQHRVLHMLAYVREYSTLATYTDTVFLFREKMVDYMLPAGAGNRFRGWTSPRVLMSKSYYRFTDDTGLDSVSSRCEHHFSWSDWVGIVPSAAIPTALCAVENGEDTVSGRYSPTEVWMKKGAKVTLDIDVMADTTSRKWVPNLSVFFRENVDFELFRVRFNYDDVISDHVSALDLTGYSFNIESNGRGRKMFMFNRADEPFSVSTYAEVYMVDKEYITVKEAKKWERRQYDTDKIEIYEPSEAPELQPAVMLLVDRVNAVDDDLVRLSLQPDRRLAGRGVVRQNIGQRALQLLKIATGISRIRSKRNWDRQWRDFRKNRVDKNREFSSREKD